MPYGGVFCSWGSHVHFATLSPGIQFYGFITSDFTRFKERKLAEVYEKGAQKFIICSFVRKNSGLILVIILKERGDSVLSVFYKCLKAQAYSKLNYVVFKFISQSIVNN